MYRWGHCFLVRTLHFCIVRYSPASLPQISFTSPSVHFFLTLFSGPAISTGITIIHCNPSALFGKCLPPVMVLRSVPSASSGTFTVPQHCFSLISFRYRPMQIIPHPNTSLHTHASLAVTSFIYYIVMFFGFLFTIREHVGNSLSSLYLSGTPAHVPLN